MTQQLSILWFLLSEVCEQCAALTWKDPDGHVTAPDDWDGRAGSLEYHAFGVFLLSHALLHRRHDTDTWHAAIEYCVAQIERDFNDVAIESSDFFEFIRSRVDAYGRCSLEAQRAGQSEQEAIGWIAVLKNNLLACLSGNRLLLKPPVTISSDFVGVQLLEIHLTGCITHFYLPMLYGPVAHLCDRHQNLLALTSEEIEQHLADGAREWQAS